MKKTLNIILTVLFVLVILFMVFIGFAVIWELFTKIITTKLFSSSFLALVVISISLMIINHDDFDE